MYTYSIPTIDGRVKESKIFDKKIKIKKLKIDLWRGILEVLGNNCFYFSIKTFAVNFKTRSLQSIHW